MTKFRDLSGLTFGRLYVSSRHIENNKHGKAMFNCVCSCGSAVTASGTDISTGNTRSCGCLKDEKAKARMTRHGNRYHPMWMRYKAMLDRCYKESNDQYRNYGARGITVCERWVNSFDDYVNDLGFPPSENHTIDRVDNNLGYSPENCRWATKKDQSVNRRVTKIVTVGGVSMSLADWSKSLGLKKSAVYGRIRNGWDVVRAVTHPPIARGKYERKPNRQGVL